MQVCFIGSRVIRYFSDLDLPKTPTQYNVLPSKMRLTPSIRSKVILAMALVLPFSVPALRAHHPKTPLPLPGPQSTATATLDAEQNAARLVDAIIQIESSGNPLKIGRHGERGLMQIRAGTWRDMTIRLFGKPLPFDRAFEPALNRRIGTAYLAWLQESLLPRQAEWQADERALLLAAFNAGPGRLAEAGFSLARMPAQTRDYVARASALHDAYLGDLAAAVRQGLRAATGI